MEFKPTFCLLIIWRNVTRRGMSFDQAYKSIRPYVEKKIQEVDYDLIIDMHRDSVGADKTTAVYEGEKYAKVAFVVGLEHPNYKHNRERKHSK